MTTPLMAHQTEAINKASLTTEFALLHEQGLGKTKTFLQRAANLFERGLITQLLVIAPNGIHKDWIRIHLPLEWPFRPLPRTAWYSAANRAAERRAVDSLIGPYPVPEFRMLTVNIEGIIRKPCLDTCLRFLKQAPTLLILDESDLASSPNAKRTRCAYTLGKRAAFRMIGTGTEDSEGALDLYSQFQFLRPGSLGCQNYAVFKAHYAEWKEKTIEFRDGTTRTIQELARYKNMGELRRRVDALSHRATKASCLDLPPKVFERRTVVLAEEHRATYDIIRDRVLAELKDGTLTTAHVLTKLTRLAQCAGGHMQLDDEDVITPITPNRKLEALLHYVRQLPKGSQFIVWARFVPELEMITAALTTQLGEPPARVWGEIPPEVRDEEIAEFKATLRYAIVAQPSAGGRGHTWIQGTYVLYYSNEFGLRPRIQSEDRAHRIGQTEKVTYVDFVAEDTIDEKILRALSAKQSFVDYFRNTRPEDMV